MGMFRRDKDDNIVLDVPYCEFYIPKSFFDSTKNFAEDFTDTMNVLGVFPVGIFEDNKLVRIGTMKVPIIIKLRVYSSEWRDVTLPSGKTEKCKVCKYFKDDVLFSGAIVEDSRNAELFLNAIIAGDKDFAFEDSESFGKMGFTKQEYDADSDELVDIEEDVDEDDDFEGIDFTDEVLDEE